MNYVLVEWEHFMSYRQRQSLSLADLGLVLINGDNRISKAANSNGAGKSAIPNVINWVKFGETFPGQDGKIHRSDAVACRFTAEPCQGMLIMQDDDDTYRIERQARPTKLTLFKNDVPVSAMDVKDAQAKINALLGYGPMTFRHAVVYGQSRSDRIMSAEQSDILRTLDEIQGVDFRKALDKAKRWRDEWKEKAAALESEAALLNDRIANAAQQIEELLEAKNHFTQNKLVRVTEAKAMVAKAKEDLTAAQKKLTLLVGKRMIAQQVRSIWAERQRLGQEVSTAAATLNQVNREEQQYVTKYNELKNTLEELVNSPACPKCRTKLNANTIPLVQKAFAPDLQAAKTALEAQQKITRQYKTLWDQSEKALEAHMAKHPTIRTESDVLRIEGEVGPGALALATEAKEQAAEQLTRAEATLQQEQAATWEGSKALQSLQKEQATAEVSLRQNASAKEQANRTILSAEFWVEAFGDRGIRSLLFESVESCLNERLQHHLAILTAGEAALRVSALSALKSGAIKEKLSLMASWMWGANSYSLGSGGQGCRIDLAAFAALQDLAASRSARPIRLRVFDEPGDGLDSLGMEIFAQWMRHQIQEHGTGILITHNDTLASLVEPDKTLTVILDNEGSHLVEN